MTHDYIQWLFPLQEKSRFNPNAPILKEEDIYFFRVSQEIKHNLICSLRLMLSFYGLKIQKSEFLILLTKTLLLTERNNGFTGVTTII
jgi:hypothetical protein